jgi:hypothetical protein
MYMLTVSFQESYILLCWSRATGKTETENVHMEAKEW